MTRSFTIAVAAFLTFAGSASAQITGATLTASPNPALVGQTVTLTATVTGGTAANGTKVTFYNGATVIGVASLTSGTATLTTVTLPASGPAGMKLTAIFSTAWSGGSAGFTVQTASPVVVKAQAPPGGTQFSLSNLTGSPSPQTSGSTRTLSADFNNDGVMDLAIYGGSTIDILLGHATSGVADGSFTNSGAFTVGTNGSGQTQCNYLVTGDFNGDGFADLACDNNGTVFIYLNNRSGGFTLKTSFVVPNTNNETINIGGSPFTCAEFFTFPNESGNFLMGVADFDQDGIPDLVLASTSCNANLNFFGQVMFFSGKGDGTFNAAAGSNIAGIGSNLGIAPYVLVVGDFNGDGKPDVLVGASQNVAYTGTEASDLFFLAGNGSGGFATSSGFGVTNLNITALMPIVAADFNNDGTPDVAYINTVGTPAINVIRGPFTANSFSGGVVTSAITSPPTAGDGWLTYGDFNGDGALDLGGGLLSSGGVAVAYGNNNATFSQPASVFTSDVCTGAAFPAAGNFAGNNRDSLVNVCANSSTTVSVAFSRTASTVTLAASTSPASNPVAAQIGQPLTLTATVTTGATGAVTFYNGVSILGTAPVNSGTAVLTTVALPPSTAAAGLSLTATYSGDVNFKGSTSTAVKVPITTVPGKDFSPASYVSPAVPPTFNQSAGQRLLQADFNNDGVMDFASYRNQVFIATGNGSSGAGNGTFNAVASASPIAGSQNYTDLVAADFNLDGNIDLAGLELDGRTVDIMLGNGDGTFARPTKVIFPNPGVPGTFVTALVAADLNGDGIPDLALPADIGNGNGDVDVLLGNGDGTFQPVQVSLISSVSKAGGKPLAMATGDFNGDGIPDMLVVASTTANTSGGTIDLFLVLGNGDGTFKTTATELNAPGFVSVNINQEQLMVKDFNGDGNADVAYRDNNGVVYVGLGSGSGTFTFSTTTSPLFSTPRGFLATGDFNGDGKLDLIGDFSDEGTVQIALGTGTGTFLMPQAAASCTRNGDQIYLVAGDYSGDRRTDFALVCNQTLTVELARPTTTTTLSVTPASSSLLGQAVSFTATVTGKSPTGEVQFYNGVNVLGSATVNPGANSGTATFSTPLLPANGSPAKLALSAHYAGDSANGDSASAAVTQAVTAVGGKGFAAATPISVPGPFFSVLGDFNNDGIADLAVSSTGANNNLYIELGNGDGTFRTVGPPLAVTAGATIAVGDFNGDGNLDLALLYSDNSGIAIYLGNGNGGFTAASTPLLSVSGTVAGITVGDFNNDGFADIAYGTSVNGAAVENVFLGNGDGTFRSALSTTITGATAPLQMALADYNQDGTADLVVPAQSSTNPFPFVLFLLTGKGDGTFVVTNLSTAGSAFSVAAVDLNGDGFPDLAYSDTAGSVHVGLNGFNNPNVLGFTFGSQFPSGSTAGVYLAVGDFNGDGLLDLAASEPATGKAAGNLAVLLGNGQGALSFLSPAVALGASSGNLVVGDFNSDHRADVAISTLAAGSVQVMLGSGPLISSLSPSTAVAGSKIVLITINGSNFFQTDTYAVKWQPSAAGSQPTTLPATFKSTTTLAIGPVDSLVTTAGTATLMVLDQTVTGLVSNTATFTITPPPSISSVAPATAAAGGTGVTLTLTGSNFVAGDTVTWTPQGGTPTAGIATVLNQNGTLTVAIASGLLATQSPVTLTVVDPSGVNSPASGSNFAVVAPPAITSLSPISIPAGSGAFQLTVTGTGFANGDCVSWTQQTPQVASPLPLTGSITPPCATTVTAVGGAQQLTVQVPANLLAGAGTANISVTDPDGAPGGTPQLFSVLPPTITGLADGVGNPITSVGTASGDFALQVNGTNFVPGTPGSIVVFVDPTGAAHALAPTGGTATRLTVTVPGSAIGSIANTFAQVEVLNEANAGTGPCTIVAGVTGTCSTQTTLAIGAPVVKANGVSPTAAAAGGGDLSITVNGSNFVTPTQAVTGSELVWCNNCTGTPTVILPSSVSTAQMVVTLPKGLLNNPGTAQLSVTNTPGNLTNVNTNSNTISFQISSLSIANITPTSVLAGGPAFTLTINGQNSNFDNNAQVLFGGGLTPIVPSQQAGATITPNQIIITVPATYIESSGTLSIQVEDSNGSVSTPAISLPISPFSITQAVPNTFSAGSPDAVLTIGGNGIAAAAQMQVNWTEGITSTPLTVLSTTPTQIVVKVPGGASGLLSTPGTATITAIQTVAGGNVTATLAQPITISPPAISTISPISALVNANAFQLTVNGSNFLSTSVVEWTDGTGKQTALTTSFSSANKLIAFVPTTLLAAAGTALVTVQNGTVISNGAVFAIGPTPTIFTDGTGVAICPSTGSCQDSSSVTAGSPSIVLQISGLNYQPGAVVVWTAGGTATNLVTGFVFAAGTNPNPTLTATVPATLLAAPTTALLTVLNPGNTVSNGVLFTVAVGQTPTLTSVTAVGTVILGNSIQLAITGANFATGALVQWTSGSTTTGLATILIDANDLSAVVPANLVTTPGTVSITVQSAGATSAVKPFTIPPVTLTSLAVGQGGPTAVAGTGPLTLTVNGGNFAPTSMVQWSGGSGPQSLVTTVVSATQLSATVPASLLTTAGTTFVTVITGTVTSNSLPFTITAAISTAPTIFTDGTGLGICPGGTNCQPATSVTAGSPSIILQVNGLNYQTTSFVIWTANGVATNLVTSFNFATNTNPNPTLTATVPATLLASPTTALITVQNPDKTLSNGVLFTVGSGATPTLTAVTAVGTVTIGSPIQLAITGANFTNGSLVQWNNGTTTTGLATTFVDANDLSAMVPANLVTAPGTVSITVQSGGATSAPKSFTIPTITLTSLSTTTAAVGSSPFLLTITGGNFTSSSVVQWNTGGTPATLPTTLVSPTQLTVVVTAALLATPGTAFVTVMTGSLTSNSLQFTVTAASLPSISSLGTTSVTAGSPGIQITINGANFASGAAAEWNAAGTPTPLTTAFVSSTQLTALIPTTLLATAATVFISVQNPNNSGTSNLVPFTVTAVNGPAISANNGVLPASASTGSASIVLTITGTDFQNGAVVQWNAGGTATPLTTGFNSATQLTALVPATLLTLPTTVLIDVQNVDKNISNSVTFSVIGPAPVSAPTLATISPTSAAAGSATLQLTVTGTNFVSATTAASGTVVQWNGAALPTTFTSATQLTATVDTSLLQAAGSNFVSVVTGTLSSGGTKFLVVGPTLTSIAPATITAGSAAFSMTLVGTNFVTGSTATWNNTTLATAVNSATQLTAQVPANLVATAGSAFVLVTNPGGSLTAPQIFTISIPPAPTIASLSPASAIAGGSAFQLSVTGSGFVNGSVVMWNGSALSTGFTSATQLTALISSSLIASAGTANVTVQNPGAPMSTSVQFAISGPTITTLAPATANAGDPAFTMTVTGTNFVPGASVLWNGTVLPSAFSSATQLLVSVPASNVASPGTVSVTVQNPGGASSNIQTFTIGQPALKITTSLLPDGVVGTAYSQTLIAQGGNQPYTWTVTSGTLPGGLNLDPASGTLSGTPTGASSGTLGITCTDAQARVATKSLQLNVTLALTITTAAQLPLATAGTAYSTLLAATGGTPSYLWTLTGNLPPGLIFNVATGQISGVPTAPGSYSFAVGITDSRQQQHATQTFTMGVTVGALTVTGLSATLGPAQQIPISVTVGAPYPVDLTGTLTVTFASAVGGDDPSIQFSTVGRTVNFTIPNGTTTAVYPQNQQLLLTTGTVSGTITLKATLQAGAADITPTGLAPITGTVPKSVPVITGATLKQGTGGVVVTISGYSTTKELTQASLVFNPASGSSLTSGTVTVPLGASLSAWYASAAAAAFGSQFTVSVPIGIQGSVSAIGSVTITLTNTQGNSAPVTAQLQ